MGQIGGWASTAETVGNVLLKLYDIAFGHSARVARVVVANEVSSQSAQLQFTHSYKMNRWDGYFVHHIHPFHTVESKIETAYAFDNYYVDTNAEAQYAIYCPKNGQHMRFEIRIRRFDFFEVYIHDHWNPCYEIHIGGEHNDIMKTGYANIDKIVTEPLFRMYKVQQFPNLDTTLRVHIKPKTDSDSPVFFEHCDFGGKEKPVTGSMTFIGSDWNDRVSSMLIPPGYSVAAYEHSNYQGRVQVYSNDCACMTHQNFNDQISSFRIFKLQNGSPVEILGY